MSTPHYIGIVMFAGFFALSLLAQLRGSKEARQSIQQFSSDHALTIAGVQRRWFDWGPFSPLHRNKSVYRVMVADAARKTFAVWFQFEHDLLGKISETQTKFEHADRY